MVPNRILSRTRRESWAVHFFLLPAVALVAPFPMKSFLPDGKLLGATGFQVRGTGCRRWVFDATYLWLFLPVIPESCDTSSVGHIR